MKKIGLEPNTLQEVSGLPDWGKMAFVQYPSKDWKDILPDASADAIKLVQKLVVYESGNRMKADQVSLICRDLITY